MIEAALPPAWGAVRWLFITHLLALVLMMIVVEQRPLLIGFALAVGASWFWLRRHAVFGFGPQAVDGIARRADGHWALRVDGCWHDAELCPATRRIGRGLLLVLRRGERRVTRLVLGADLPPDTLRRLRIAVFDSLQGPQA